MNKLYNKKSINLSDFPMGNVYCWNIKKIKFHGANATFPKTRSSTPNCSTLDITLVCFMVLKRFNHIALVKGVLFNGKMNQINFLKAERCIHKEFNFHVI